MCAEPQQHAGEELERPAHLAYLSLAFAMSPTILSGAAAFLRLIDPSIAEPLFGVSVYSLPVVAVLWPLFFAASGRPVSKSNSWRGVVRYIFLVVFLVWANLFCMFLVFVVFYIYVYVIA